MKSKVFQYILIIFACFQNDCAAQLLPYPSWAQGLLIFEPTPTPDPIVDSLDEYLMTHLNNGAGYQIHGAWQIRYNVQHGEIAFKKDNVEFGSIDTGFDYVFHVGSSNGANVFGVNPDRILVSGRMSNGSTKVLSMSLDDGTDLASATFVDMTGSIANGAVISKAFQVGTNLYLVNATDSTVIRYHDSDADGLPDAPDGVAGLPVGAHPNAVLSGVRSIHLNVSGAHQIKATHSDVILRWIVDVQGSMTMSFDLATPWAIPHFFGHKPVAGMTRARLRFVSSTPQTIWVESDGVRLSDVGAVNPKAPWVDVNVTEGFEFGARVRVVTSSGIRSGEVEVLAAAPVVFGNSPYFFKKSDSLAIFQGCNLGGAEFEIVDHEDVVVQASVFEVHSVSLVVDISLLDQKHTYWIKIRDSDGIVVSRRQFRVM